MIFFDFHWLEGPKQFISKMKSFTKYCVEYNL